MPRRKRKDRTRAVGRGARTAGGGGYSGRKVRSTGGAPEGELGKLRAERDTLLDRLARLQAEFENSRKRAVREQQEFRDYALADALKTLLPISIAGSRVARLQLRSREFALVSS